MSDRPTPETDVVWVAECPTMTWKAFKMRDKARDLERQRDEAREELLKLCVENDHNWQAVADLEKMTQLARELRDALQAVDYVDLSPCNGGSCMVATDADDAIDAIKNKAAPLLTKAKEVLP